CARKPYYDYDGAWFAYW
nr:immunoglobulin heavy chain junction region [Mus musculus]MBK4196024.1 immunoglobulin heavy chain junction region [Mus musculus]